MSANPGDEELQEYLRRAFEEYDENQDSTVDRQEFAKVLLGIGIDGDDAVDDLIEQADVDADGRVNYEEFVLWASHSGNVQRALGLQGLSVTLTRAWNIPDRVIFGGRDPQVIIDVLDGEGASLGQVKSRTVAQDDPVNPVYNQALLLPAAAKRGLDATKIKITLKGLEKGRRREWEGSCTVPLRHLVERPVQKYLLCDAHGHALLATNKPHHPCEIEVSVDPETMPSSWPRPAEPEPYDADTYPKHVFLMTRGTLGDVQPFVALARGLAEQLGWLVTICTEIIWRDFVLKKAVGLSQGKIRFRPSGGNTPLRMDGWAAKKALASNSEMIQMTMMANSEAEFFSSLPVFMTYVQQMELEPKPVDLLIFGLTVAGVAALIGEYTGKPIAGFFLQPTCIPSEDEAWKAVIPLTTHAVSLFDAIEHACFTSQKSLARMKQFAENNPFSRWTIENMRGWYGLRGIQTWDLLRRYNVPIAIPMREGTFPRPNDWWEHIGLTDFIFLRGARKEAAADDIIASLGEQLGGFIANAKGNGSKLGLMTFSSMPVSRAVMLKVATKMVEECAFDFRLIYVGPPRTDKVPDELAVLAAGLTREGRFLELARADFGVVFAHMDCFVVHGGLGTTVEALRRKKPCVVTGPLLLDQRFWGNVVHQKGVGPEPKHIDCFGDFCVDFANGALDPDDPQGWQAAAAEQDWGDDDDDGVEANVRFFYQLMAYGLEPIVDAVSRRFGDD